MKKFLYVALFAAFCFVNIAASLPNDTDSQLNNSDLIAMSSLESGMDVQTLASIKNAEQPDIDGYQVCRAACTVAYVACLFMCSSDSSCESGCSSALQSCNLGCAFINEPADDETVGS